MNNWEVYEGDWKSGKREGNEFIYEQLEKFIKAILKMIKEKEKEF